MARLLALVLLLTPAAAQWWRLYAQAIYPSTVNYEPTDQDMICGVVLGGVPSGTGDAVIVTGFDAAALGCPSSPPVVVWGDDGNGNTVYAATLGYLWLGPYTYDDPTWGSRALADYLAQNYYVHLQYDTLPAIAHWQRFDRQVTYPWDPSVPLPAGPAWRAPPATDDYLEFGDPLITRETNLSGFICTALVGASTCWYAVFYYALPVRLVIVGDESPDSEGWAQYFASPVLVAKSTVSTLSLRRGRSAPRLLPSPGRIPPEIRRQLEDLTGPLLPPPRAP